MGGERCADRDAAVSDLSITQRDLGGKLVTDTPSRGRDLRRVDESAQRYRRDAGRRKGFQGLDHRGPSAGDRKIAPIAAAVEGARTGGKFLLANSASISGEASA